MHACIILKQHGYHYNGSMATCAWHTTYIWHTKYKCTSSHEANMKIAESAYFIILSKSYVCILHILRCGDLKFVHYVSWAHFLLYIYIYASNRLYQYSFLHISTFWGIFHHGSVENALNKFLYVILYYI